MKCPVCNGEGGKYYFISDVPYTPPWEECIYCNGKGKVNIFKRIIWKYYERKKTL